MKRDRERSRPADQSEPTGSIQDQHKDMKTERRLSDNTLRVMESFGRSPKSMTACSVDTDILHCTICGYVDRLEREGKLYRLYKRACSITKFKVYYFTTDRALFIESVQQQISEQK